MRLPMTTVIAATLAFCGQAGAENLPAHAQRVSAPVTPAVGPHISGAGVKPVEFAEWEIDSPRGKSVAILTGDALSKAPANASRYEQKTFEFPTGEIRILTFHKDKGGMVHEITAENALFMLKGSGTVEVAGKPVELHEGDAVNYPSGVLRGKGDATVIVWTVTGTSTNEASKAQVVRAKEAKTTKSAEWHDNGKLIRANKPEELKKAPKDAVRLAVTRYQFDGNSIRVAHNYKGGPTSAGVGPIDALIYVTSGHLTYFEDDKPFDVVPGDAVREVAGLHNHWIRLEDSSFVAISTLPIEGAHKTKDESR